MSNAAKHGTAAGDRRVRPAGRSRPGFVGVHRLIQARAAKVPGATAVTCGGRSLTYADLETRANRLAHRLRGVGVGPDVLVGLCLGRSVELVVGILGVLKAGGAYVPLDPSYPADRLAFMAADARLGHLLTLSDLAGRVPAPQAHTLLLDADWPAIADESPAPPPCEAGPDHLAYVIYTSGSTGRPKGAMVTHRGLSHYLQWCVKAYQVGDGAGAPVHSSVSFDLTVTSLFAPLVAGRRVDLLGDDLGVEQLAAALTPGADYSLVKITPAHLQLLGRQIAPGEAAGLTRAFVVGGEQLTAEHVGFWREHAPETRIINEYGPTETVVGCSIYEVFETLPAGAIPIGRPIRGVRMVALDRHMRPVPLGVTGKLYVGGPGVARGYLGRPGLTAEKFGPDPWGDAPGARLYRTGDLARRRPDGDFEFLGRADQQVKIRGHRVEPGEVEVALGRHPDVRDAAVVAFEFGSGDHRLVAYVAGESDHPAPTSTDLREFLARTLPEPMLPSVFVPLAALPLSPNGKVDRAALPAPESRLPTAVAFEPPRDDAERTIAGVWSAVLGVERIGVHDNFFDLGGHSLLATQVVSRLREAFGREVPVRLMFEAPTVAGLALRIGALTDAGAIPAGPEVLPRAGDVTDESPLSFSQQALWYVDQLAPNEPTFNVSGAVRVTGPLDVDALRRAFAGMLHRHEALRTTFHAVDGEPVARVVPRFDPDVPVVDLSGSPRDAREAEAGRLAAREARAPFRLDAGPLARACVLKMSEYEHAILLTMHHIVTDGWSFGVAAGELAALYEAFRSGRPSPLPGLTLQYADYAAWQRDRLRGPVLDGLLAYWTARLDGLPHLELPTDRPRPAVRSARGATVPFAVPADVSRRVADLGRSEGATPFMTLLAVFQALLSRYSGQTDFAVGSPVANRSRTEIEGLIGYFVNMIAVRADVSGDPTFRTLIGRARESALGAFEHQELPFDVLVGALRPPRDPSRTPLYQVMFVLQNTLMPDVGAQGLTLGPLDGAGGTGTAKFDLSLGMAETEGGFAGSFEYATDLFDRDTIDRLIGHFLTLLDAATGAPDRPLSTLPIMTPAETVQALNDATGPAVSVPAGLRVHNLFEAQVRRTPDAPAVVSADLTLTYRELNERADRLAGRLRGRGVGPDVRVAVALRRSPELLVAMLGVLKAGGAYVPLDVDYPPERLAFMVEDSSVALVIGDGRAAGLERWGVPVLSVDDERSRHDGIAVRVEPDDAAYVLYTSGSTGVPKGVVVTHRGLVNHNLAAARLFDLGPGDRVLQFCSVSFDIAAEEIFPAWASGAAVVLREEDHLDPTRLADLVERDGLTVLDLPTAFWHAWVKCLADRGRPLPACLRLVVVGGEEASAAALEEWRAVGGRVRWMNTYGPTEATIIATADEPVDVRGPVPIGWPIANVRAHVLDPAMSLLAAGLPGELYLGGEGVARGYLNQPGRTAAAFVPDPFSGRPGARLYRTGDRARRRSDGRLEFLGRIDGQVKVRGFRVEPGEVESALTSRPGVAQAAVVVRDDGAGGSLSAFVVARRGLQISGEALRRDLRERLPRHLVPSSVVVLDALPMTPGGKVDRRALATYPGNQLESKPPGPPRDELERRLIAIAEDVLNVRPIGPDDDFFDLGGHSLLAVRLLSRVEAGFGVRVELADLLRGPTIENLARLVREPGEGMAWSPLVTLAEGGGAPLFLVHPVGGGVVCYSELARALGGRPVYGLQARGLDGGGAPLERVEDMAALYLDAVRTRQPSGPYHLAGWSMGGVVAFEMARRLRGQGEAVGALVLIDSSRPGPGSAPVDEAGMNAAFARNVQGVGADSGFETARVDQARDAFHSHCRALAHFEAQLYPGPLTLIRAGRGANGWESLAGDVCLHEIPGDHFSILRRPTLGRVASIIADALKGGG